MTKFLTAVLPAMLLCVVAPMGATTIDFTYTGAVSGLGHSSGPGSFSFADGLTTVGLADLTDFTFNLCINNGGSCFNTFALTNLTAFAATISGGWVTDLSLSTDFQTSPNPAVDQEQFVVSGLGALQASNIVEFSGFVVDRGRVVVPTAPTPEPSTWTFLLGSAALAGTWKLRALSSFRS